MNNLEIGDVFSFKNSDKKYVYYGKSFKEWYNSGGMGEYTFHYIDLEKLLIIGNIKDTEKLSNYILTSTNQNFLEQIEKCSTEAPFEIDSRTVTLYTVRRKQPKQVVFYE